MNNSPTWSGSPWPATPRARGGARDERGTAAIAGRTAAEIYGLTLLANEIEDRQDNTTRFLVVGRKLFSASGSDRTTLLVSAVNTDDAGALFRLLEPLSEHGVNMTRIESRPSRKRKWDYVFFIDIEGHVSDPAGGQGAGRARGARVLVQGPRLVSAGRALMSTAAPQITVQRKFDAHPVRTVSGSIAVPGDKSISHRSLMLSGIAQGTSEVSGFLASEDCLASLAAMRALGVPIEQPGPTRVSIRGVGLRGLRNAGRALDMGNAGTAMRLFTGLLSAQAFDSRLIGDESLMRRPMERVAKPLREMGADVRTHNGTPPVDIGGGRSLRGIEYGMPVASAQVKSAVLLAALYADGPTTVIAPAVNRDHSERMLESCGVRLDIDGLRTTLHPPRELASQRLDVPGDFSSAAFFIVAGLLGAARGGLLIRNVGLNPTRTGLLDVLRSMGGDIVVQNRRESGAEPVADLLVHASALRGVEMPAELVPLAIDELPILFVAAACAAGETVVTGAEELRVKESDRIAAMSAGLTSLGVIHSVMPDGMRIQGRGDGPAFSGGEIDSFGDHRIAMSFTVASLRAAKPNFDPGCGERGDLVSGLRGIGPIGGLRCRRITRLSLP